MSCDPVLHWFGTDLQSVYSQEWLDGHASGIYDMIPTWAEWCNGVLPTQATSETLERERPIPHSESLEALAGPIEQPIFEGPQWSNRVQQQWQRPDNVYGDNPFIGHLTECQWDEIIEGRIPQPNNNSLTTVTGNLLHSYISRQPATI